jgi:hypothetical protein
MSESKKQKRKSGGLIQVRCTSASGALLWLCCLVACDDSSVLVPVPSNGRYAELLDAMGC